MNSFKTVFALALVSVASALPIQPSGYDVKVHHAWTPITYVSETLQSDWRPVIKSQAPVKQTLQSEKYTLGPVKNAIAPVKYAFAPIEHVYAPIQYNKGLGSYGKYDGGLVVSYEHLVSGFEGAKDKGFGGFGGYEIYGHGGAQNGGYKAESHGNGGAVKSAGHGEAVKSVGHGGAVKSAEHEVAEAAHDDGHVHKDYFAHPAYKFEYGVKDPHTGDHKSQWEHRDGDKVVGEYTLDEADGTKRVVSYTADKKNGFQAIVKKIGHALHIIH